MSHTLRRAVLATLLATSASTVLGALPIRPPEMMLRDASAAVQAKVLRIDQQTDSSRQGQVITYAAAELEVVSVLKGIDVQPGDKITVKYWWRKWLPGAAPMPGSDGNANLPSEGETLQVYLSGSRGTGYQVLLPNGFVK